MRVTVQVGLGFALMGGLLMVACGDESRADRAIDSPVGSGGMATPARGGAPGAAGIGGAPGTGGALGTGGARPSGGESPPPPAGAIRLIAPLSGGRLSTNQPTVSLGGGRRRRRGDGGALRRPRLHRASCSSSPRHGSSATAPAALAAGHVFWRVRGGTAASATWEAFIPHRTGNAVGGARDPARLRRRRVRRLRARRWRAAGRAERLCAELPAAAADGARRGRDVLRGGGQSERRRLRRRPAARQPR